MDYLGDSGHPGGDDDKEQQRYPSKEESRKAKNLKFLREKIEQRKKEAERKRLERSSKSSLFLVPFRVE